MISVKVLINEIEKFISENENEFEFIVDFKNIEDNWEINFEKKCINILECCNIFVRENDDNELENWFKKENLIHKKIKINNCILYIMM